MITKANKKLQHEACDWRRIQMGTHQNRRMKQRKKSCLRKGLFPLLRPCIFVTLLGTILWYKSTISNIIMTQNITKKLLKTSIMTSFWTRNNRSKIVWLASFKTIYKKSKTSSGRSAWSVIVPSLTNIGMLTKMIIRKMSMQKITLFLGRVHLSLKRLSKGKTRRDLM